MSDDRFEIDEPRHPRFYTGCVTAILLGLFFWITAALACFRRG
jgi:hypothetical protein